MEALFALAGVVVGVAITSGYAFWDVRRSELARAAVAAHALDVELKWLHDEVRTEPLPSSLTVDPALDAWREQRAALALFMDYTLFSTLAKGFQEAAGFATLLASGSHHDPARQRAVGDARRSTLKCLEKAQATLTNVRRVAEKEHNTFILSTLGRALIDTMRGRSGPLPLMVRGSPEYRKGSWLRFGAIVVVVIAVPVSTWVVVSLFRSDDPITVGDAEQELREMEPKAVLARCAGDDDKDRWTCTVAARPCMSARKGSRCLGRSESRLLAVGDPDSRAPYFTLRSTTLNRRASSTKDGPSRLDAWYRRLERPEPRTHLVSAPGR